MNNIAWFTSVLQPNLDNLMPYLREQSEVIRHKFLKTPPSELLLNCTKSSVSENAISASGASLYLSSHPLISSLSSPTCSLLEPRHTQVSPPRAKSPLHIDGIPAILSQPSCWKVTSFSGSIYIISSIHFPTHHKQAPTEVNGNCLPPGWSNPKGILIPPNYRLLCSTLHYRPLSVKLFAPWF